MRGAGAHRADTSPISASQLVDLQGNIRVYCRVRPVLPVEDRSGQSVNVCDFPEEDEVVIRRDDLSLHRFEFNQVFTPASTQAQVFAHVEPLVASVMDGYNACIFAYGQTGSGKTFTMEGARRTRRPPVGRGRRPKTHAALRRAALRCRPHSTLRLLRAPRRATGPPEDRGVNHRALEFLYSMAAARAPEMAYSFRMSVLEIYNEAVHDLLSEDKGEKEKLDIRIVRYSRPAVPRPRHLS